MRASSQYDVPEGLLELLIKLQVASICFCVARASSLCDVSRSFFSIPTESDEFVFYILFGGHPHYTTFFVRHRQQYKSITFHF